eukprot:7135492-Prymnesium_polylepis.1
MRRMGSRGLPESYRSSPAAPRLSRHRPRSDRRSAGWLAARRYGWGLAPPRPEAAARSERRRCEGGAGGWRQCPPRW